MKRLLLNILFLLGLGGCSAYYEGPISDHFDGKVFFDPHKPFPGSLWKVIKWKLTSASGVWPKTMKKPLYEKPVARVYGSDLKVTYLGHVTFLIQTQGLNILTDPVWSNRASPVSFWGPKRVIQPGLPLEQLPPIDVIYVSHNHYDHLDVKTLDRLWTLYHPRIITPLGNDRIIQNHNPDIKVEACDWGEHVVLNSDVALHLSPMQHWSARGIFDRNKALWAAMTLVTSSGNIYFIGDSGYGEGRYFKADREKFGKPRLALLPMGAYKPRWFMDYAHMGPQEMVGAHEDLGEPYTVPSHYDVFPLANENYGDALKDLEEAKRTLQTPERIHVLQVGQGWFVPSF